MRIIGIEDDTVKDPCMITPFFLVHVVAGYWLACVIKTLFPSVKNVLLWVIILHTIYEIKDYYVNYVLKYNNIYTNSSWWNSIGDTIAAVIGYYIYEQTPLSLLISTVIYLIVSAIGWGSIYILQANNSTHSIT